MLSSDPAVKPESYWRCSGYNKGYRLWYATVNLLWAAFPVSSSSALFSEHAQYPGRCTKRREGGFKRVKGGLCFQGDGNTRLYTAAAVLCNRAVTMTVFKGLGWRKKGRSSLCLRATHTKRAQIWKSMLTLCRHDGGGRFVKDWKTAQRERTGFQTGRCAVREC